jgi:hypothetical protein
VLRRTVGVGVIDDQELSFTDADCEPLRLQFESAHKRMVEAASGDGVSAEASALAARMSMCRCTNLWYEGPRLWFSNYDSGFVGFELNSTPRKGI